MTKCEPPGESVAERPPPPPPEQAIDRARALAREALDASRTAGAEQALEKCDQALALLFPLGLSSDLADVLRLSGSILRDTGNDHEARRQFNQSLAVASSIDYVGGRAHALNCLGSIAQLRGELLAAEQLYMEAGDIALSVRDLRLWAFTQQNRGTIAEDQGRAEDAQVRFQNALAALEECGNAEPAMAWLLNNLGVINLRDGLLSRACEFFHRAREQAVQLGDTAAEGTIEENFAMAVAKLGMLGEAEAAAERAYAIAEQRHDLVRRAAALRAIAIVRRHREEDWQDVSSLLETALVLLDTGRDGLLQVEILMELGDVYHDAQESGRAQACWRRAQALANEGGFRGQLSAVQKRLSSMSPLRAPVMPETNG